jgi:hypothetical protein
VHLYSTEKTTFREVHSLYSDASGGFVSIIIRVFLLMFRFAGNLQDVHLYSTEKTTFREVHSLYSDASGGFVSITL